MRSWGYRLLWCICLCFWALPMALLGREVLPASVAPAALMALCALHVAVPLLYAPLVPKGHRLVLGAAALLAAVAEFYLLPFGLMNLLVCALLFALSLCAISFCARAGEGAPGTYQLAVGIGLFFVLYALAALKRWDAPKSPLVFAFVLYGVFVLFCVNVASQKVAAGGRSTLPLRQGNFALFALFALLLVALANIDALRIAAEAVVQGFLRVVAAIVLWLSGLFAGGSDALGAMPGQEGVPPMLPPSDEGSGLFARIMNVVAIVLSLAAVLFLLLCAGRALWRGVRKLIAWLRERMGGAGDTAQGFDEEQSSLMNLSLARKQMQARASALYRRLTWRAPNWDKLGGREKVRFALMHYQFLRGTPAPAAHKDVQEIAGGMQITPEQQDAFARAYDAARYAQQGDPPLDEALLRQVAQLK